MNNEKTKWDENNSDNNSFVLCKLGLSEQQKLG